MLRVRVRGGRFQFGRHGGPITIVDSTESEILNSGELSMD
jgi:hypothetical protein